MVLAFFKSSNSCFIISTLTKQTEYTIYNMPRSFYMFVSYMR